MIETIVGDTIIKTDTKTETTLIGKIKSRIIKTFYVNDGRTNDPHGDAVKTAQSKLKPQTSNLNLNVHDHEKN